MKTPETPRAQPPETLEGWFAHHQVFTIDRAAVARREHRGGGDTAARVGPTQNDADAGGWSAWARLIGFKSDLLCVRFAPTLDDLGNESSAQRRTSAMRGLRLDYSFLSVTEAGLYNLTSELVR